MTTRVESALGPHKHKQQQQQQPVSAASVGSNDNKGNWRGKYLRALNIATPEVDVVSRKKVVGHASHSQQQQPRRTRSYRVDANKNVTFSRSFNTSTEREGDEFQARVNRYQVAHAARYGVASRRGLSAKDACESDGKNPYGFAVKPDLARERRCHTDPFVVDEKVSAPIQIPTVDSSSVDVFQAGKLSEISAKRTNSTNYLKRHGSSKSSLSNQDATKHSAVGNLLSWEEPAKMMLAAAVNNSEKAPLGGLDIAFSSMDVTRSVGVSNDMDDLFCDEFVETEDEEEDDDDDDDYVSECGDDDQIFEMEDFDSSNSNDDDDDNNHSSSRASMKPRRQRTASESLTIGSHSSRRSAAMPRYHSVRQMRTSALELPESFVPPHQLIQRDCFSIGLRDEFKRRPAKI